MIQCRKKIVIIFSIYAFTLIYTSCTSIQLISENDLQRAKKSFPTITLEELQNGQNLYYRKCGSCHYPHKPEKFTADKWKSEIQSMTLRAKINSSERQSIIQYLTSRSKPE